MDRIIAILVLAGGLIVNSINSFNSVDEVPNSPELTVPLKVGQVIPDVNLVSLEGKSFNLRNEINGQKSVIVFYRGGWCPYCNKQLAGLGKVKDDLDALGYQLISISPDSIDSLKSSQEKNSIGYRMLSDSSADAMKAFGVAFRLDDTTFTKYKDSFGLDIEKAAGGKNHHILPVPAVFVVNGEGKITFTYSNVDYKVRLSGEDLLKAARG